VWVREPAARALSAYYYIAMSDRRTAAVNAVRRRRACAALSLSRTCAPEADTLATAQLGCGFAIVPMGRRLEAERLEDRAAFAAWGYLVRTLVCVILALPRSRSRCVAQALQRCALAYRGGGAAHVRVFLPQWGYFAPSASAGVSRLRALAQPSQRTLFVGTTEEFDASLALLARWAGWPVGEMRYGSRARQYNERHPTPDDWAPADVAALGASLTAAGETAWHAAALAAWREQAEEMGDVALAEATRALRQRNAAPRSAEEREADRALRRKRHRPDSPPRE
jgi:hypothetical protein